MKPRFASAVITTESYAQQVFRCTLDEWRRLPVQWRGFVLHKQQLGFGAKAMLDELAKGMLSMEYDPQGVFDAFQGHVPA